MNYRFVHLPETDSTNRWLAAHADEHDMVVWTDFQTAGRGCGTNSWESEPGQNLLFSMLIHPTDVAPARQFAISMAISLDIVRTLQPLVTHGELSIKWPNDIYWNDRKLAGILIESQIAAGLIRQCIIGVGLNVNQTLFRSDAPNPVSLRQITGQQHDREPLLRQIADRFTLDISADDYRALLYRRRGMHPYRDAKGDFTAELLTVEDDGHLLLRDSQQHTRRYAFKEVTFLKSEE